MIKEKEEACPKCGSPDTWIWMGWAWRKDGSGVSKKNIHRRRCSCGKMYSVVDNEGYNKLEGINAECGEPTNGSR